MRASSIQPPNVKKPNINVGRNDETPNKAVESDTDDLEMKPVEEQTDHDEGFVVVTNKNNKRKNTKNQPSEQQTADAEPEKPNAPASYAKAAQAGNRPAPGKANANGAMPQGKKELDDLNASLKHRSNFRKDKENAKTLGKNGDVIVEYWNNPHVGRDLLLELLEKCVKRIFSFNELIGRERSSFQKNVIPKEYTFSSKWAFTEAGMDPNNKSPPAIVALLIASTVKFNHDHVPKPKARKTHSSH
jgi:hypothetical protein